MTHTITWDHAECEHDDDYCGATAKVTCDDPECFHRNTCNGACETITDCGGNCDEQDPIYAHSDPGVPHDDYGHPLTKGDCNAVLFLEWSDDITDDYLEADDDFRRDGPIDVEWNGEYYEWRHQ